MLLHQGLEKYFTNLDKLGKMRVHYGIVVIAGIIGVIIGKILSLPFLVTWFPPFLMIFYIISGIGMDKNNTSSHQFGDSIYFLGFLFTLIGLAVALYGVDRNEDNVSKITGSFTLALITTIIGVVARTLIVSFSPDPKEAALRANQDLERAATNLQIHIERLSVRMLSIQEHFSSVIENVLNKLESQMSSLLSSSKAKLNDATKLFSEVIERNVNDFDSKMSNLLSSSEAKLNDATKLLMDSLSNTTEEFQRVDTQWNQQMLAMSARAKELEGIVKNAVDLVAKSLDDVSLRLGAVQISPNLLAQPLTAPLNNLASEIKKTSDLVQETNQEQDNIRQSLSGFGQTIDQAASEGETASKKVRSLTDGPLGQLVTDLTELGKAIAAATENIEKSIQITDSKVTLLQEGSMASTKAIADVTKELLDGHSRLTGTIKNLTKKKIPVKTLPKKTPQNFLHKSVTKLICSLRNSKFFRAK